MHVEQVSIFLENKPGRLAEVTQALSDASINIKALSLADTSEFGILRIIFNSPDMARAALKKHGFTVGQTDVVAVEVPHTPGALNSIVRLMGEANVNIEYMYGFPCKCDNAVMIFRFDKLGEALTLLRKNNFRILSPEEVYG